MVKKADLCDWFQALPAHKRIDTLCALLHICQPLELRFFGTVIEDLAKKDFHFLRDQEIKANQRPDLTSNNNSGSLGDEKLRSKVITALALMNSTNLPCAEVIFDILQLHLDNLLQLLHSSIAADELLVMLTMAVHHPAFTFYQKTQLGHVLERVEERIRELYGDNEDDKDFVLQSQTLSPDTNIQGSSSSLVNSQSLIPQLDKATVVDIKVVSAVPSQIKKGGDEYRIHTTWSNEKVTEVFLKFKQLQDLHHKLLNKFPDEKRTHVSVPVFPGAITHKEDSLEDKINSLNAYFSKLAKAPAHILDCDIFTEPLRNGDLVYQPKCGGTPHTTAPSKATSSSQTQEDFIQTSPLRDDEKIKISPYRQSVLMSYSNMVAHSNSSPGTSQMSSAANSPDNSGNTSPVPLVSSRANYLPSSNVQMNTSTMPAPQPVRNCDQISQLLQLLHMEEYYDNLKDYPFHQIMYMSKEEFAKAGLPAEAQAKLKSRLDQVRPADFNGIIDPTRFQSADTFFPPICYHPSFTAFIAPPYPQHFIHPSYAAQPGHISMLSSGHAHIQTNDNSPANSETSSPPASPMTVLPLENTIMNQSMPESTFHLVLASSNDRKPSRNTKVQLVDTSGSEEETTTGYDMELGTMRNKGRSRPQHSRSLPLINQGAMTVSAMEASKLAGVHMSSTQSHPGVFNAETRASNTPPLQTAIPHASASALVNGYISSDSPTIHAHGATNIVPRSILSSVTYKTAQPAHTSPGVHTNIMNMPPDISHLGKNSNNLPLLHGNLAPQSYSVSQSVPPTHVIGLNPGNFPVNSALQLGSQPSLTQSVIAEGSSVFPMFMYAHPRGILTTMANSTAVMTSTQSHNAGPAMSHSPSPAVTAIDQIQASTLVAEVEANRSSDTPPVLSAVKSQPNSGSPSPPLVPAPPKQAGANDAQPSGRGHQFFGFQNGYYPPIIYHHPAHFPNGLPPDFGSWLRLPQVASSHYQYMHGNVFPQQNVSGTIHTAPNSNPPTTAPTNPSHASAIVNGKSRCYNCGLTGHKPSECHEIRMENMSNTFHLSYKPSDSPA